MMTCQELATCMQYDLPVVVIVANNGMYGTIRDAPGARISRARRRHPAANPDFAKFAESFGGHGETVTRTDDFPAALERALASGKPAVIEFKPIQKP